jgi:hypothetical protein
MRQLRRSTHPPGRNARKVFEVETLGLDLRFDLLGGSKRMGETRWMVCQASVLSVAGSSDEDLGRAVSPLRFQPFLHPGLCPGLV